MRPSAMGSRPHAYDLVEADERDFAYDARTGESIGSTIPGTLVIGTAVPSASSDSPKGEQFPRTTDVPAPPSARPTSTPVPTRASFPSPTPSAGTLGTPSSLGWAMIVGGIILPVARLLGIRDPVIDNLPGPMIQIIFVAILAVTLGASLAAGTYSARNGA